MGCLPIRAPYQKTRMVEVDGLSAKSGFSSWPLIGIWNLGVRGALLALMTCKLPTDVW